MDTLQVYRKLEKWVRHTYGDYICTYDLCDSSSHPFVRMASFVDPFINAHPLLHTSTLRRRLLAMAEIDGTALFITSLKKELPEAKEPDS